MDRIQGVGFQLDQTRPAVHVAVKASWCSISGSAGQAAKRTEPTEVPGLPEPWNVVSAVEEDPEDPEEPQEQEGRGDERMNRVG